MNVIDNHEGQFCSPAYQECTICTAEQKLCETCGESASCVGAHEGNKIATYSCDDCCSHGKEDGWCESV